MTKEFLKLNLFVHADTQTFEHGGMVENPQNKLTFFVDNIVDNCGTAVNPP